MLHCIVSCSRQHIDRKINSTQSIIACEIRKLDHEHSVRRKLSVLGTTQQGSVAKLCGRPQLHGRVYCFTTKCARSRWHALHPPRDGAAVQHTMNLEFRTLKPTFRSHFVCNRWYNKLLQAAIFCRRWDSGILYTLALLAWIGCYHCDLFTACCPSLVVTYRKYPTKRPPVRPREIIYFSLKFLVPGWRQPG